MTLRRGDWRLVSMDYASTFSACLPAQTQRFAAAVNPTASEAAFNATVTRVDTVERLLSNLLSDIYTARYVLIIGVVVSTLTAHSLLMVRGEVRGGGLGRAYHLISLSRNTPIHTRRVYVRM